MKRTQKINHEWNALARIEGEALGHWYAAHDLVDSTMMQTGIGWNRVRKAASEMEFHIAIERQRDNFSEALGERSAAANAWYSVRRALRVLDDEKYAERVRASDAMWSRVSGGRR